MITIEVFVGDVVPPANIQDTTQQFGVETIYLSLHGLYYSPDLRVLQEDALYTCTENFYL